MALTEFELIRRYFNRPALGGTHPAVVLGPGDDAAIVSIPSGQHLVMSVDLLNEGVHFPLAAPADLLAERCLRVNLSDLAAMGAEPLGFTLALSMPVVDENWLQHFSEGLTRAAGQYACPLLGGDTSRGPLSISIQIQGLVPAGKALLRSGARAGDRLYVTGDLGRAAAALWYFQHHEGFDATSMDDAEHAYWMDAFYRPEPRLSAGQVLRGLISAALDLSDGLASDLHHLLSAGTGKLGADINSARLPLSLAFRQRVVQSEQLRLAVSGGDDYELCVCVPPQHEAEAIETMEALRVPFTCIGLVSDSPGIRVIDEAGNMSELTAMGYRHFDDSDG